MTRRMLLWGAAALAVLLAVLLRATTSPEAAGAAASNGELAKLHQELADLRERVNTSDRSAALAIKLAAAAPAVADSAAASESEPSAAVEQARPKFTLTREEMRSRLNERFTAERADLGWSKPAQALIDRHLQAGLPDGSHLLSVDCRRTMCRVEAQHSNLEVYHRFVDKALLFRGGGWNGPVMTGILNPGDAQVNSVAYLLRDGADFASLLE